MLDRLAVSKGARLAFDLQALTEKSVEPITLVGPDQPFHPRRRNAGNSSDLASHVRLIRITRIGGDLRKTHILPCGPAPGEKALNTRV